MSLSPTPAIQAWLEADPELQTLAPDGVWEDPALDRPDLFVAITLVGSTTERCAGGTYALLCTYDLAGVSPLGDGQHLADCRAVQTRLHALVSAAPITLPGWRPTAPVLDGLVEGTRTELTTGRRWIVRGGRYRWRLEPHGNG